MKYHKPGAVPGLFYIYIVALFWLTPAIAVTDVYASSVTTLIDEAGNVLLKTCLRLSPGDGFISSRGYAYKVVKSCGTTSHAVKVPDLLKGARFVTDEREYARSSVLWSAYSSHPWESYLPDDTGTPMSTVGDIKGVANDNYNTSHNSGSAVILDILRDTADTPFMVLDDGVRASSSLMVVDKVNGRWKENLGFAVSWKGLSDSLHPGLVRGIILTKAGINQDISPTALTLLVGDRFHNPRWAERGLTELTRVLPGLFRPPNNRLRTGKVINRETFGYRKWFVGGLLVLIIIPGLYALLPEAIEQQVGHYFVGSQAAAFLGRITKRRKN